MRSLLLCVLFLSIDSGWSSGHREGTTYVWICTGPKAVRYHKTSSCRGLDNCSEDVVKVSLSRAKELKRTACGICYR